MPVHDVAHRAALGFYLNCGRLHHHRFRNSAHGQLNRDIGDVADMQLDILFLYLLESRFSDTDVVHARVQFRKAERALRVGFTGSARPSLSRGDGHTRIRHHRATVIGHHPGDRT